MSGAARQPPPGGSALVPVSGGDGDGDHPRLGRAPGAVSGVGAREGPVVGPVIGVGREGPVVGPVIGVRREGPVVGGGPNLPRSWYEQDSLELAPALLNKLVVVADGRVGRIVEVEAYRGGDDPGSHAYRGRSARNDVMWGSAGHLYVYFTYGMHWCANVVTAREGVAQAVLLRALAPVAGVEAMRAARCARSPSVADKDLCRGPARLCQALSIDERHGRADLVTGTDGVWLADDGTLPPTTPAVGPRVGLSAGASLPWRFWLPEHPAVSSWRAGGRRAAARPGGRRQGGPV